MPGLSPNLFVDNANIIPGEPTDPARELALGAPRRRKRSSPNRRSAALSRRGRRRRRRMKA